MQLDKEAMTDVQDNLKKCADIIKMNFHYIFRKIYLVYCTCQYWSLDKSSNENEETENELREYIADLNEHACTQEYIIEDQRKIK